MIRNVDQRRVDVVRVIRLGKLMAKSRGRVFHAGAVPLTVRRIRRIHGDSEHVRSRRNGRLTVAAIEDEVLAAELPDIRVGPAVADALIARDADPAAAPEL